MILQIERPRTAAAVESRPKGGCCNQRLSGLLGDVAKIYFQTQSHSKHEYLHSKQQPTIDNSAEAPQAVESLSTQKTRHLQRRLSRLCHIVPDYRTFIDDYLKIVEFIEWLKDFYPEKAEFLTKNALL